MKSTRIDTIKANLDRVCLLEWVTAQCRDVTLDELLVGGRSARIIATRHKVWSLIHGTCGYSQCEIARIFLVDHVTVIRALQKRERELAA
jgi:chromosomal replication initiation ATPase DnaA